MKLLIDKLWKLSCRYVQHMLFTAENSFSVQLQGDIMSPENTENFSASVFSLILFISLLHKKVVNTTMEKCIPYFNNVSSSPVLPAGGVHDSRRHQKIIKRSLQIKRVTFLKHSSTLIKVWVFLKITQFT